MPRPGTPIVHPDLLGSLEQVGMMPQTVTVQTPTSTRDAIGTATSTWAALSAQATDVAARVAPAQRGGPTGQGREVRAPDGTWVEATHIVVPVEPIVGVDETMRVAVSGGSTFEVAYLWSDADGVSQWLFCRAAT